jgi:hypothetical protein
VHKAEGVDKDGRIILKSVLRYSPIRALASSTLSEIGLLIYILGLDFCIGVKHKTLANFYTPIETVIHERLARMLFYHLLSTHVIIYVWEY